MAPGFLFRLVALVAVLLGVAAGTGPAAAAQSDGIPELLEQIRQAVQAGDIAAYLRQVAPTADRNRATQFATAFGSDVGRVIVRERDRRPLGSSGSGLRLMVEVFTQTGSRGQIETWRLDVRRRPSDTSGQTGAVPTWTILNQEILTTLQGLIQLALDTSKQYVASNLSVLSEDFELKLPSGSVFVAETTEGVTGLVLLGRGEMIFSPPTATERGQLRIFCGQETLRTSFETAFIRLNPGEIDARIRHQALRLRPVNERDLRRAETVFKEQSEKSFVIDLSDLTTETWSLQPPPGDFIAEVGTRKYGLLTYARSAGEPEDITLFDRDNKRTISIYPSRQKFASRGRFYDEDARADYDVLDYYVDTTFNPDTGWIQGRTRLQVKILGLQVATLSLRLADSLVLQSVSSEELGRLLHLRVRNQNTVVVNLPTPVLRDQVLTINAVYSGPVASQTPDREALQVARFEEDFGPRLASEPNFLYSNRAFWYPQATTTDYATATLRLTVPATFGCVASGELVPGSPVTVGLGPDATKVYVFMAKQPVRYLAAVVSRLSRVTDSQVTLPGQVAAAGAPGAPAPIGSTRAMNLVIEANPRQHARGVALADRAAEIVRFYTETIGDCPYPAFTLALVENDLPGGHSPAYFAALNQPPPSATRSWRNDPASFDNFPEFFLAHEVAHQWWGQAVGWKNFHEQWISEGFAQYFAALYGRERRGDDVFQNIIRQFRRWSLSESEEGPIYLGYRLGHIKNDGRIFRALVYNKGAGVLHMLRRLVGDEPFFRAIRKFYTTYRFQKAGTDDLRKVFEAETGRRLERFFEGWIYEDQLPEVRYRWRLRQNAVELRFEQPAAFDFPVTVTLEHDDRTTTDIVVVVTGTVSETRIESDKPVKNVIVNGDEASLAIFARTES